MVGTVAIVTGMTTLVRTAPAHADTPVAGCSRRTDQWPGPPHPRSDDELIAHALITLWALATGRRLPDQVPPSSLSEQELITFWSDPVLDNEEDC